MTGLDWHGTTRTLSRLKGSQIQLPDPILALSRTEFFLPASLATKWPLLQSHHSSRLKIDQALPALCYRILCLCKTFTCLETKPAQKHFCMSCWIPGSKRSRAAAAAAAAAWFIFCHSNNQTKIRSFSEQGLFWLRTKNTMQPLCSSNRRLFA